MNRYSLYLFTQAILFYTATVSLAALKENRLDVYLSLFVLAYFVTEALFRPRHRTFNFLALVLLILFIIIVSLRVMEVLFG
jgi:hypothetical protein